MVCFGRDAGSGNSEMGEENERVVKPFGDQDSKRWGHRIKGSELRNS